jgi:hypothetical protein
MRSPHPIRSPMRPGGLILKYTLTGPCAIGLIRCGGGQFEHGHACGANKSPKRPANRKFTRTFGDACVRAVGG